MTYKFYNSVFLSHGLDLSPDTEAATAELLILGLARGDLDWRLNLK